MAWAVSHPPRLSAVYRHIVLLFLLVKKESVLNLADVKTCYISLFAFNNYISIYIHISLSIYIHILLSIYIHISLSIYIHISLSIYFHISLSIYISIGRFIQHLSVYLNTYLSISFLFCFRFSL